MSEGPAEAAPAGAWAAPAGGGGGGAALGGGGGAALGGGDLLETRWLNDYKPYRSF